MYSDKFFFTSDDRFVLKRMRDFGIVRLLFIIFMHKKLWYFLLAVHVGIMIGFWLYTSGSFLTEGWSYALIALGRITGLLAAYFVLLQFFFVGRTPWLERVFGLDSLIRMHRRSGQWGILLLLVHPAFLAWGYGAGAGVGFFSQMSQFVFHSGDDLLAAAISLVLFLVVVGTSITLARKHFRYESWYGVHLLAYIAVFLSFGHQIEFGTEILSSNIFYAYWVLLYVVVFGHHLIFRFIQPLARSYRHQFRVSRVVKENANTCSVYITGNEMDKFSVQPGQFMIFRFLAKGLWWQAHPFSLSAMPANNEIRITMKAVGDFTTMAPARIVAGMRVVIDGPYGVFTSQKAATGSFLFIAGGIGITPIRSMMESLVKEQKDMVLLYGSRTAADAVFADELKRIAADGTARVVNVVSDDPAFLGEQGKIDQEKIKRLVPDAVNRDVYVCGPPPMMNGVIQALKDMGVPATQIHFEKFVL